MNHSPKRSESDKSDLVMKAVDAVSAAKELWGCHWKSNLRKAWETDNYPSALQDHIPSLQWLRNQSHRF